MIDNNDAVDEKKGGGRWYAFAIIFVILTIILAFVFGYDADAEALASIFMGTFSTSYDYTDEVAQQPETGNVISTPKTVVIAGSKWRLVPGFQIEQAKTSDNTVVKITKVRKRIARIKAMKVGTAEITITGTGGETQNYTIIVEDPQVKNLKIVDFVRLNEDEYITGVKYLKPTAVSSSRKKIAQIYLSSASENMINVFGSGRTRITVRYGDYKRKGTIKAKLPYMASKDVTLSNKPKKISVKNIPTGWTPVYRSTNSKVAVCNSNGYVAPKGNGTCTIYTRIGNTYLICHVKVSGYK